MDRPKLDTQAKSPLEIPIGDLVDLERFGFSVPEGVERLELATCTFERYLHCDPTGFRIVYWRRIS